MHAMESGPERMVAHACRHARPTGFPQGLGHVFTCSASMIANDEVMGIIIWYIGYTYISKYVHVL